MEISLSLKHHGNIFVIKPLAKIETKKLKKKLWLVPEKEKMS